MAGYKKAGADLDTLLEPWQAGDGNAAATGFKIAGADLNTKYAPASAGTGYTGGTNYKQAGADIGPRFCAKGTRLGPLAIDGNTYHADSSGNISAPSSSAQISINANGSYNVHCVGNGTATPDSNGSWLPSGDSASDWQVQFVVTTLGTYSSGGAGQTNGAAAYSACTTTRTMLFTASVGQTSAQDKGGTYSVAINLKKVSTGQVITTTVTIEIEAVGTG